MLDFNAQPKQQKNNVASFEEIKFSSVNQVFSYQEPNFCLSLSSDFTDTACYSEIRNKLYEKARRSLHFDTSQPDYCFLGLSGFSRKGEDEDIKGFAKKYGVNKKTAERIYYISNEIDDNQDVEGNIEALKEIFAKADKKRNK